MLSLLVFVGEGVRDAFAPRKLFTGPSKAETAATDTAPTPAPAAGGDD
jgi:hypothetical protein